MGQLWLRSKVRRGATMSQLSWAVDAAPFEVSLTRIGGLAYARLSGEADICGWQALDELVDALTTEQTWPSEVVFDLTQLRFACVRTVRVLADIGNRLRSQGIPTQVRGMQPIVARVAKLVDVDLPSGDTPGADPTLTDPTVTDLTEAGLMRTDRIQPAGRPASN